MNTLETDKHTFDIVFSLKNYQGVRWTGWIFQGCQRAGGRDLRCVGKDMSVSNLVKRLQDIMRNDAGINGDAQRIEQIGWLLLLKMYDYKEEHWELHDKSQQPPAKPGA
jgi:hypothetical protein